MNTVFFVENGNVYKIEVYAQMALGTEKQAFFTKPGPLEVTVGDSVEIGVEWRVFSGAAGSFVYDGQNTSPIKVYDGGAVRTVTPVDGRAKLTLTSSEPGELTLSIINTTQTLILNVVEA
ncbi:hypothetical protein ACFFNY_21955 [Paenibacillus hodogayensis]|uniref:BIG2 domain-containing protein n=1 Tax=Paenibacillus hodogayensis TaxID=279208 RepID=A0ABV5W155_9BACL